MQRQTVSTKKELDEYIRTHGFHYDDPQWEKEIGEIINRGKIPKAELQCEFCGFEDPCPNPVVVGDLNYAGEYLHVYCEEHKKWADKHIRIW